MYIMAYGGGGVLPRNKLMGDVLPDEVAFGDWNHY